MKRPTNYVAIVTILVLLTPLYGAETKPSTWQKFKNVFSSKKPEQNQSNDQKNIDKPGFFKSISNVYKEGSKFGKFSKEQTKMIEVKIKTLELVQERINKISKEPGFIAKLFWKQKSPSPLIEEEKVILAGQIGRLRADLFMTFVEVFQEMKPLLVSLKEMMTRGLFKDVQIFDTMIQSCESLVLQGNDISEKLLRASNAYGKKDSIDKINEESQVLINGYFKTAVSVMSKIKPAMIVLKGVISTLKSGAYALNAVSLGSISSITATLVLIDKALDAGKIAADLSRDIFAQVTEKSNLKAVESKLVSLEKEIDRTSKSFDDEDILNLDDLMQKNK